MNMEPHKTDPDAMMCCSAITYSDLTKQNGIVYATWRCRRCGDERYQVVGEINAARHAFSDSGKDKSVSAQQEQS